MISIDLELKTKLKDVNVSSVCNTALWIHLNMKPNPEQTLVQVAQKQKELTETKEQAESLKAEAEKQAFQVAKNEKTTIDLAKERSRFKLAMKKNPELFAKINKDLQSGKITKEQGKKKADKYIKELFKDV